MQFERTYSLGSNYCIVDFNNIKISLASRNALVLKLQAIGGIHIYENQYRFPKNITSEVIQEIIKNHCFVCGGLMQNSELHIDHILRTCQDCGHFQK